MLEPPTTPTPTHRIARHVKVERNPSEPHFTLSIDGEVFPYFLAKDAIKAEVGFGMPGTVTLTLIAERIEVDDRYCEGAADALGLDHDHEDDREADYIEGREDDEAFTCPTDGCLLVGEHDGPCL